jgi:hypothetical protein
LAHILPNFLIIGAARSGTTTLYSHLQLHPDVYLPANKRPEPHFFLKSAEYSRGLEYYQERYFSASHGQKAIGEASTSYLFGPDVPGRIHSSLPSVKLICILRNPVERAFSGYWHTVKGGLETLSFAEAVAAEAERRHELAGTPLGEIAPFAYAERGLYHRQLVRWLATFDRAQMKIVIFDDFVGKPGETLADIARFLDVSPDGLPRREVQMENKSAPDGAQMPPETRAHLIDAFHEDVDQLSTLLGRDLTHWLQQ